MQEIIVDENGYKQYLEELEKLKNLSLLNSSSGSEAYNDAIGDGWHDNFAFEESMRESRNIAIRIEKMLKVKENLKIIKKENIIDKDIINLDDTLIIEIKYSDDDIEEEKIKITGNYSPNIDPKINIQEITLNSPIGKALYKKSIKDENIKYSVNDKEIYIKVKEKIMKEGSDNND